MMERQPEAGFTPSRFERSSSQSRQGQTEFVAASPSDIEDPAGGTEGHLAALGAGAGALGGGSLFAFAALGATACSSIMLPVNELMVSCPIYAGLLGVAAGAANGGLAGALVGWGIPTIRRPPARPSRAASAG